MPFAAGGAFRGRRPGPGISDQRMQGRTNKTACFAALGGRGTSPAAPDNSRQHPAARLRRASLDHRHGGSKRPSRPPVDIAILFRVTISTQPNVCE